MSKEKIVLVALIILIFGAIFWFIFSSNLTGVTNSDSQPIDHHLFTEILSQYVNQDGWVDYQSLGRNREKFDEYLKLLSSHHPNQAHWSVAQQKAYWINAYNAFTLQLILNHPSVKSIKELGGAIYRVNTAWDIEFINIEGHRYDLNDIEHNILRKNYTDPRIHFALNCASRSCPELRREAYEADQLDAQLDDAGKRFLSDPNKNKITENHIQISRVFKWFPGDFTQDGDLIDFLNKFSNIKISEDADIDYLEYDWGLNKVH